MTTSRPAEELGLLAATAAAVAAVELSGASVAMVVAAVVAAIVLLRPGLAVVALVLLISLRSQAEQAELSAAATRPVTSEWITLTRDPQPLEFGWYGEARLDDDRVRLSLSPAASSLVAARAVGDELRVTGSLVGRDPAGSHELSRRLVGELSVVEVHEVRPASGARAWATRLRRTIERGARSVAPDTRALFTGLVFGDDRNQSADTADAFRAAGLGHLLAVSGQNVVFVLMVLSPVTSRLRSTGARLAVSAIALVSFGFVTRFEPSVTRALVMAAIVLVANARGAPLAAARVLPLAVMGLLIVDPLLGYSLAFRLSVAATAGLIHLAPRWEERLPGPDPLRTAVASTLAAQLAVAPLLLGSFGSVSLLAVPANVMAAPAAALVMMWGLTAGLAAGVASDDVAELLHLPTRLAVGWIELVAARAAVLPVGQFRVSHLAVAGAGGLILTRRTSVAMTRVAGGLAVAALVVPLLFSPTVPAGRHRLIAGVELNRSSAGHDVVVLDRSFGIERVLESLRTARVGRIDLLVSERGDRPAGRLVRAVAGRHRVTDIWAPPGHQVPGARVYPEFPVVVGTLMVEVGESGATAVTEHVAAVG